jgi:hypothetical protein
MKKPIFFFGLITCLYLLTGCNNAQPGTKSIDYKDAENFIKESEKQWAESVATGDSTVVERILADDFIGVDPDGNQYNKQRMIHGAQDAPKYFKSNHLNNVKVRFYGLTAVAQGDETWVRYSGQPVTGRFVWTDTWIMQNSKWQIVAAEDLIAPVK